jgi:hypothetical protein
MGHIRLGNLHKTRRWTQVIDMLDAGVDAGKIASGALDASERAFVEAGHDPGFKYTVWLLTQVALAAKKEGFREELVRIGLDVPKAPGLFDVLGAFTKHIDVRLDNRKTRTDISEMCQLAAVEALSERCIERSKSLFGTTPDTVRNAFRELSTEKNFALLARDFFSRFTYRYLSYFLSREVPKHVGPKGPLATIDEHGSFNEALALYCRQSAEIVREFSGGWYSKTAHETGITEDDAGRFAFAALKKLTSELKREVAGA